jgi:hypothetical protein
MARIEGGRLQIEKAEFDLTEARQRALYSSLVERGQPAVCIKTR